MTDGRPGWQCVLMCRGTKYPPDAINHLIDAVSTHSDPGLRPLNADERFLSRAAQARILALPSWFAVKFPVEFMFPWRPWLRIRAALPWVQRRRAGLVAVTLCGDQVKAATLLALQDRDEVTYARGRILIWTDALIGPLRARVLACCAAMV